MSEKKIIFMDVDGTLLDYSNHLPESAKQAVQMARERGHRVYISTGRSKAEVYPEIWDVGFDGMIGGNGSYVEDHGYPVMHQRISEKECRELVDWMISRGLEFYLESNAGLFASKNFETRGEPVIQAYSAGKGKKNASSLKVRDAFPDMIYGEDLYRGDVNKISFILEDYQDYLDAKEAFPNMEVNTWGGKGEKALFGDFGVKNITKGNAIAHLLSYLNAKQEDTIAFGDAAVDIPMFEACHFSVCMGSGGEAAKNAADYITDDVDQDGLWNAFVYLGLIPGQGEGENV